MGAAIDWILTNQLIPETLPGAALCMTSYGLSEVVLHSGGAHMTSHNKQHGGLHVVLGGWYKTGPGKSNKDPGKDLEKSWNVARLIWTMFILINMVWILTVSY